MHNPEGMVLDHTYAGFFNPATSTINSSITLMTSHVCRILQPSNTNHQLFHHTDDVTRMPDLTSAIVGSNELRVRSTL
jgi:hypothetical protein